MYDSNFNSLLIFSIVENLIKIKISFVESPSKLRKMSVVLGLDNVEYHILKKKSIAFKNANLYLKSSILSEILIENIF